MEKWLTLLVVIIALAIVYYFFMYEGWTSNDKLPFKKKEFLMNIPERKFYELLLTLLPEWYVVYPQVLLSSIVKVTSSKKTFWKRQNKINRKTIDFVIFSDKYITPVAALEYDGSTHNRKDRIQRDELVNSILLSAWIPILHFHHKKDNETALRLFIQENIS